jgi:CheY-like chemotaxis protein
MAVGTDVERAPSAVPPPPPPPPEVSIFDGKEDYVRLGWIGVLLMVLTARTLVRHRREAEIRALHGGYLSDGTEVARFQMPEFFAPAPEKPAAEPLDVSMPPNMVGEDPHAARQAQMAEFLEQAPACLATLRKALQELGRAGNEVDWRKALAELPQHITALKDKANFWEVRPVWQLSSALELLAKRVADKPKDATPSTLRTITAAADLLHTLCAAGIRPNLVIDPPIQILAADDDALCLRAIVFALQKASLNPDVAENGKRALALATNKAYDVIFMDIQMPEMDGLAACQEIHKTEPNAETPVVFVTIQSDFHTRAQTNMLGGSDLMAKPFLVFELTVKALMFVMRKRLGMHSVSKAATRAALPAAASDKKTALPLAEPASPESSKAPVASTTEKTETRSEGFGVPTDFNSDFFVDAPNYLSTARRIVEAVRVAPNQEVRVGTLGALHAGLHTLAIKAKLRELPVTGRVCSALEALLKKLHQNPKVATPATLDTVSSTLNFLDRLCVRGTEEKLADSAVRLLVVDDEPLARRAVVGALQK